MGKKARKTRWRALAIDTGNQSDSEESHGDAITGSGGDKTDGSSKHYHTSLHHNGHDGGGHQHNGYQHHYDGVHRGYRAYSSTAAAGGNNGAKHASGGHRRFQSHYASDDQRPPHYRQQAPRGASTVSATAASTTGSNGDAKITFNEDEYTRITTPRQDVLFKKGYLSKPKTFQTQTSTGASTISTGNSTGNGTPDHQSADGTEGTDMEYESQFVFPNGFVDQNGIYYMNSYEPYPLVVYNTQMCYPEYVPSTRSKRLSTGSLTESTSPHNEETSQELSHSGGETVNYPEYGNMYNVVFPGYFYGNGVVQEIELANGEPRKIKKRRRRKLSKPVPEDNWTTSSDEYDESEEMVSEIENRIIQGIHRPPVVDTPPSPNQDAAAAAAPLSPTPPEETAPEESTKMVLKPDAKEFVPRSFVHHPHHAPFIANLIPLPPPFLHAPPAMHMPILQAPPTAPLHLPPEEPANTTKLSVEEPEVPPCPPKAEDVPEQKNIDIAKIVTKLEEAAKEQRRVPKGRRSYGRPLPVELTVYKKAAIKLEIKTASTTTSKNYAQMLSKKTGGSSPVKSVHSPSKNTTAHPNLSGNTSTAAEIARQPAAKGQQSQWIAVHSRKKRKNKNQEADWDEKEEVPEIVEEREAVVKVNDDGFEVYDVSKLEDVVVPRLVATSSFCFLEPLGSTSSGTSAPSKEDPQDNIKLKPDTIGVHAMLQDPKEIRELPKTDDEEKKTAKQAEEEEFDKLIRTLEELEAKTPQKKPQNKSSTKRVMITDTRMALPQEKEIKPVKIVAKSDKSEKVEKRPKEEVKESFIEIKGDIASKISKPISIKLPLKIEEVVAPLTKAPPAKVVSDAIAELNEVQDPSRLPVLKTQKSIEDDSPEKKRKKKKKSSKKTTPSSIESPTNTPTTPSIVAGETSYNFLLTETLLEEERTNVEVSEELDKIIQRGMFSSLEEKIKSLNITAVHEGFFKSMSTTPAKRSKEDDLTSILTNTTNIFKAKRPLCQHQLQEPSTTGSFLDVTSLREDPGVSGGAEDAAYPITRAVKDWMVRTRESTPEVELLKSPRTILMEIGKNIEGFIANTKEDEGNTTGSIKESWSLTPESSFDDDLLECWDDLEDTTKIIGAPQVVEEIPVEEVYESLYGQNEDFKQIKAEIEERQKNGTLPKHGGLPYHAICCSVM